MSDPIDIYSDDMYWVLVAFLMDSLEFLDKNPKSSATVRGAWVKSWQKEILPVRRKIIQGKDS